MEIAGFNFGGGHIHNCGFSVVGSEWAITAAHCGTRPGTSFAVGAHALDEVTEANIVHVTAVSHAVEQKGNSV